MITDGFCEERLAPLLFFCVCWWISRVRRGMVSPLGSATRAYRPPEQRARLGFLHGDLKTAGGTMLHQGSEWVEKARGRILLARAHEVPSFPEPGPGRSSGRYDPTRVAASPTDVVHQVGDRRNLTGEEDSRKSGPVPVSLKTASAWSWRILVLAAALYLLLRICADLLPITAPLLVAILLAALLQPGAAALVRSRWPRALAALLMLLAGALVVAGIMFLVINRVAANWNELARQLGRALTQLQRGIVRTFPITQHNLDQLVAQVQKSMGASQSTSGALQTAGTVTQAFSSILLTLLVLFFYLKDGRAIWLWVVRLLPVAAREPLDEAAQRSWQTLISYVRATVAVAAIDAVGIGIALVALGVPLALPLAALVFLGAFIPVIGAFLAAIVAVLVTLVSNGYLAALIALGAAILVMQLEGNIFSPLLLGRAVRVHPLGIVLALGTGAITAGIFGALIAVPLVACLNVAIPYLAHRRDAPPRPEPGPAPIPAAAPAMQFGPEPATAD